MKFNIVREDVTVKISPEKGFVYKNSHGNFIVILSIGERIKYLAVCGTSGELKSIVSCAPRYFENLAFYGKAEFPEIEIKKGV